MRTVISRELCLLDERVDARYAGCAVSVYGAVLDTRLRLNRYNKRLIAVCDDGLAALVQFSKVDESRMSTHHAQRRHFLLHRTAQSGVSPGPPSDACQCSGCGLCDGPSRNTPEIRALEEIEVLHACAVVRQARLGEVCSDFNRPSRRSRAHHTASTGSSPTRSQCLVVQIQAAQASKRRH